MLTKTRYSVGFHSHCMKSTLFKQFKMEFACGYLIQCYKLMSFRSVPISIPFAMLKPIVDIKLYRDSCRVIFEKFRALNWLSACLAGSLTLLPIREFDKSQFSCKHVYQMRLNPDKRVFRLDHASAAAVQLNA